MKYITDLHIHSPYSRAVSPKMTLTNIAEWANWKGIDLVGTGDFAHPDWLAALKRELEPIDSSGSGFFQLRDGPHKPQFLLTTEIANIFSDTGKVRRNHTVLMAPSFEAVDRLVARLSPLGRLASDGRPLIGMPTKELARLALEADPHFIVIPAHAWTPWFSVFGSKSGFDTLEESFGELTPQIPAIETGLSSDPPMNWRTSALDKIRLVSFSDAHSLPNLGREVTVVELEGANFASVRDAFFAKGKSSIIETIEFFPEEGKYHFDGHATCKQRLHPKRTRELKGRCPVCGKAVTVGVLSRVEDLADRPLQSSPPGGKAPFRYAIPLAELIADVKGVGKLSKTVYRTYHELIRTLGAELPILLDIPIGQIKEIAGSDIAGSIAAVRAGAVEIDPGYDGLYGTIHATSASAQPQKSLFG